MKKKTLLELSIILMFATLALFSCDRDDTYIVSFDANGGSGRMQSQLFDVGVPQALTQNAYTRDGYTFSGWNTMQAGNGTAYTNGQTITVTSDMTLYAQWTSNGTSGGGQSGSGTHAGGNGVLNGHEYVDLGLPSGTKWATCNVGANTPEGYGHYFPWGGTRFNDPNYYYTDFTTTLPSSADAATAYWGNGWRMPTKEEMEELLYYCYKKDTTLNDINGILFKSNNNGNSIFLPFAGSLLGDLYDAGSEGCYWSSSFGSGAYNMPWNLHISHYATICEQQGRLNMSVRPVCNRYGGQEGSETGSGAQTVGNGILNGHNYVDLGLPSGAKWATCNVGADTPEGYGNYYAWGETTPKETYNWETYIYAESDSYSDDKLTKYCTVARDGYNGFTDGFTTLETTDDAATVNWGSGWRMPTYGEMVELKINCTETWITQNGVNGCLFTGPNGNSIFLPLAGYRYNNSIEECYGDCGYYLSSSINPESPTFAYFYYFFFDTPTYMTHTERSCGYSVRAVCNQ